MTAGTEILIKYSTPIIVHLQFVLLLACCFDHHLSVVDTSSLSDMYFLRLWTCNKQHTKSSDGCLLTPHQSTHHARSCLNNQVIAELQLAQGAITLKTRAPKATAVYLAQVSSFGPSDPVNITHLPTTT